jgi:prevent-host-death family protein
MQVSAANFKANCLKYMDLVAKEHEEIIITKRGKQLVKLVPLTNEQNNNIFGLLKGTIKFNDNIIDPLNEIEWEAQNGNIQLI